MVGFDLFGLAQESEVLVWPENAQAFDTFSRLRTQWRVGMGGPTGLDYTAVLAFMRRLKLSRKEADDLFDDVQVMEYEAMQTMADARDRE